MERKVKIQICKMLIPIIGTWWLLERIIPESGESTWWDVSKNQFPLRWAWFSIN